MDEKERESLFLDRRLEITAHTGLLDCFVTSLTQDFDTAGGSGTFFDVRENINRLIQAITLFVRFSFLFKQYFQSRIILDDLSFSTFLWVGFYHLLSGLSQALSRCVFQNCGKQLR
jgi:hypothetical protein